MGGNAYYTKILLSLSLLKSYYYTHTAPQHISLHPGNHTHTYTVDLRGETPSVPLSLRVDIFIPGFSSDNERELSKSYL